MGMVEGGEEDEVGWNEMEWNEMGWDRVTEK